MTSPVKHAQTIAMARGLLADGRVRDVARMLEPLIEPVPGHVPGAFDASQLVLRSLLARVRLLHYGDPAQALALLRPFEAIAARETVQPAARAEVTLWLGWTHTWPDAPAYDNARAVGLFDEAEGLFRQGMNASGRFWALLGRALALYALGEYPLMRRALREADAFHKTMADVQATCWTYDLHILADQVQGRYARALVAAEALAAYARSSDDRFALGRARAYQAALADDLGRPADHLVEAAAEATSLLEQTAAAPGFWLTRAYRTHVRAEIRRGAWDQADRLIATACNALNGRPTVAFFHVEQARLEAMRGRYGHAAGRLKNVRLSWRPPYRLSAIDAALVGGSVQARLERFDDARALAERALGVAREAGHPGLQLHALLHLAGIHQSAGDAEAARRSLHEADAFSDAFSGLPLAALRFSVLGEQALYDDTEAEARAYFDQARAAYTLVGDRYQAARMQVRLAELEGTARGQARTLLEEALETFEALDARADRDAARDRLGAWPAEALPAPDAAEPDLGAALARAALSVDLIAEAWLTATRRLLPDRWLGIYRCDEGRPWTCVRELSAAPATPPHMVEPCSARLVADDVLWLRLRGHPGPAFFFGVTLHGPADPAWEAAAARLQPWLAVAKLALDHALLRAARRDEGLPNVSFAGFVYGSPAMRDLVAQIQRMRASHNPVLVTGERGTGKEVVARAVHAASERRDGPFVRCTCAGIAYEPFERLLFGQDVAPALPGALRAADGGTLFLDAVEALPLDVQARLLRFLEAGEVYPVDGRTPARINVRLIAATSGDLMPAVQAGRFLEALYYRLHVIPLHVPPLRERKEEIPLLVRHFLAGLRPPGAPLPSLTHEALEALLCYDWPGNVRQLRNELEQAFLFVRHEPAPIIDVKDLSPAVVEAPAHLVEPTLLQRAQDAILRAGHGLDDALAGTEKVLIERVLAEYDGQITASAGALGLTRQGLYKKIKRLGIDAARF